MSRIVEPEILDGLSPEDPAAIRSRRDLRLINKLMGGQEWILKQLAEMTDVTRVVELGAGDGALSIRIKDQLPECDVVALDLVPRPDSVRKDIQWVSSSVLDYHGYDAQSIIVANLFIHHLQEEELRLLGEILKDVKCVLFAEPYRGDVALWMSKAMIPFVNHVTQHDMVVSIRAGFCQGEIDGLLGTNHRWDEQRSLFGGIRMKGLKE